MNMRVNSRIFGASLIGIAFVAGAFVLSSYRTPSGPDPRLEAVTGPAPERDYIEVSDIDGNGVADWKQTLPEKPDWLSGRNNSSTSTATTTPTHTETVAVQTLQRLMNSNMYAGFGDDPAAIAADSQRYIAELASDPLYSEADITVSEDTSDTALRAYGNRVAAITFENAIEKDIESELAILNEAVRSQNPEALRDLALIEAAYEGTVSDMLIAPVPRTYIKEHLDLTNTYNAILIDIRAMQLAFSDPLYALVRLQRYEDDGAGLYQAIVNLYTKLHLDGIEWGSGDIASKFIRIDP